jgi:hypothetical protein
MKRILAVLSFFFVLLAACNLRLNATRVPLPKPMPVDTATPPPVLAAPALSMVPRGGGPPWLTYINHAYGFELQYPPGAGGIVPGATDTSIRIQLPITPGTNLVEKYLDIDVQVGNSTCQSPEAAGYAPGYLTPVNLVINGLNWVRESSGEGAAGSMYDWTAYSTTSGNVCVSLTFVLHSHNPQVFYYNVPPTYNSTGESAVFGSIVSTFQWLSGSAVTPTATPSMAPVFYSIPTLVLTHLPTLVLTYVSILSTSTPTPVRYRPPTLVPTRIRIILATATPTSKFIILPIKPIILPTTTPTINLR